MNSTTDAHEQQKESREPFKRGWKERATNDLLLIHLTLLLHHSDLHISPLWSKLWDLDMQVQELSKSNPTST